jgi:hypothetical protein
MFVASMVWLSTLPTQILAPQWLWQCRRKSWPQDNKQVIYNRLVRFAAQSGSAVVGNRQLVISSVIDGVAEGHDP